jgi:hypothetical protein
MREFGVYAPIAMLSLTAAESLPPCERSGVVGRLNSRQQHTVLGDAAQSVGDTDRYLKGHYLTLDQLPVC